MKSTKKTLSSNRPSQNFRQKKVALLRYLEAFHQAHNRQELLQSLQELLSHEFAASHVLFSALDVRSGLLVYALPNSLQGTRLVSGTGFAGRALETDEVALLQRPAPGAETEFLSRRLDLTEPIDSVLVCTLSRDDRVLGAVELINRKDKRPYAEEDRDYLRALAPHMSIALNHFVLREEALRRRHEESILKDIARTINSTFDLSRILETILDRLKELIPYDQAAILLFPSEEQEMEMEMAVFGYEQEDFGALIRKAGEIRAFWRINGPAPQLLSREDYNRAFRPVYEETQAEVVIPLRSGDRLIGLFTLTGNQPGAFAEADVDLLDTFASQVSLAIERARLHEAEIEKTQLEQELRIAREIQMRFLPERMPPIQGLEIATRHVASRLVSGDYYDFIPIVEGQWGVVIGDVSGKGISAGLIMSAFRAALLAEIRNNFSISVILSKVNRLLWETTGDNRFVTAFYGVYDEQRRILTYSNAGHNPVLLQREDGTCLQLKEGGTILGGFPESAYSESTVVLQNGDLLVLYTDGVVEVRDEDGQELGLDGLKALLEENRPLPAAEIADRVAWRALRSGDGERTEDDATVVVIRVLPV